MIIIILIKIIIIVIIIITIIIIIMMWELKQRYNGYRVEQFNVIIDVLGGYSKHLEKSVRKLLGARARSVLERMQKSVISNTLNIARTFKINT